MVWNRYSNQFPAMVGTRYSTNKKHMFYNSMVQVILIGVGDCITNIGCLCDRFVDMGALVITRVGNVLLHLAALD